jgi:hypothetical protein
VSSLGGRTLRAATIIVGLVLVAAACGDEEGVEVEGLIDREAFIATYVDLRRAALQRPTRQLPDTARDRILAAHGVTRDQLMQFAEIRGGDPAYMVAVWTEVSQLMAPPDTAPPPTSYLDTMTGPRPPSAPLIDTFVRP